MPIVQHVLAEKDSRVYSTSPATSVLEAIAKMNQHKIGALVVMQDQKVVGMFTERDVLRRVVGDMRNPADTAVAEVMTTDVVCVGPQADLDEVSEIMRERRIRHVPVCDGEKLLGMISIGDVNALHASNQQAHIHYLSEYIYGRV